MEHIGCALQLYSRRFVRKSNGRPHTGKCGPKNPGTCGDPGSKMPGRSGKSQKQNSGTGQIIITKLVRSTESRNEGQFPSLSFSERDSERSGRFRSGVSVEGRDVLPLQLLTSERSLQESGRDGDETDRLRSIRAHSWLPRSLFAPARLSHLPPKSTEGRIFLSGPNHLGNQDFWTLGDTSPDSA